MEKRYFNFILLITGAFLFLASCSTEKNTGVSRAYHNITTRFNVLFNAKESYKKGLKKAEESKQDDFTHILPLFLYGDDQVAQSVSGDMDAAAKKATKAINLHSIKAKPKVKKSGMTPADRKFYDKREFNKYIDDSYLLIGKSYVYRNEFRQAESTFSFMETEFAKEDILYETKIWKARTAISLRNYREAAEIIKELYDDEKFPADKKLKAELDATYADLFIKQGKYPEAIEYIEKALVNIRHKNTKIRFHYVLAQLYLTQKDYANASENFQKVIRMNPPYEMTFNATISRATAFRGGDDNVHDIRKQLNKMLRDAKNIEYHDQIYYALAEIEMHEKNMDKAIEYYQKSAQSSVNNIPQKIKSYLTLANLFYDRRNYVPAEAYYDSAMVDMKPDYPNFIQIESRSNNLTALVQNLQTVSYQDSVMRIARMPASERDKYIDNIINELVRKEQLAKEQEAIQLQQYYSRMSRQTTISDPTNTKAQWYFYTPTTVSQGIGEFKMKWGQRKLEDNWRRRDRGIAGADAMMGDGEDQAVAQKVSDNHTREYYLQDLPLTDSSMVASNKKIEEALYAAGYIYNNDFSEYALAATQYEELIRRYPQSEYVVASYYYLYRLYSSLNDVANANKYKDLLLTKYPESAFARIVQDPSYLDKMLQQKGEAEQLYEKTYALFKSEQYPQVIQEADNALKRFPKDALVPKFSYLKALSTGRTGSPEIMREEMKKIITAYPKDEVAVAAQEILNFIDGKDPEMKRVDQVERAKSLYSYTEMGIYYFGWLLEAKEDINQASFDLLNFNLDYFPNIKLDLERNNIDPNHFILLIKSFPGPVQAQAYYQVFITNTEAQKNIRYSHTPFIISEKNYRILQEDKKVEDYIEFFKEEYIKK